MIKSLLITACIILVSPNFVLLPGITMRMDIDSKQLYAFRRNKLK